MSATSCYSCDSWLSVSIIVLDLNDRGRDNTPHAQHINQMLLRQVILLAHIPLQRGKNRPLLLQCLARRAPQRPQLVIRRPGNTLDIRTRESTGLGHAEILELFAQDNDGLLHEQRVALVVVPAENAGSGQGGGGGRDEVRLGVEAAGGGGGAVEEGLGGMPEGEDVVEAGWVELYESALHDACAGM